MQEQLEGVARERVDAFSQGGGVVALLAIGGEPVSHILANLSIQQRQQVGMGTRQRKMQKEKKNEGCEFRSETPLSRSMPAFKTVLVIRIGVSADSHPSFSVSAYEYPDPGF